MTADQHGELVSAMITLMAGIWATLTGFGIIGKKFGEGLESGQWPEQVKKFFRWAGPLMVMSALFLAGRAIMSP